MMLKKSVIASVGVNVSDPSDEDPGLLCQQEQNRSCIC